MKRTLILTVFAAIIYCVGAPSAYALDPPHNIDDQTNKVNCSNCHYTGSPGDNSICLNCHNTTNMGQTKFGLVQTHVYGGSTELLCRTCHNPHFQKQASGYPSEGIIDTGTATSVTSSSPTSTLTDSTPNKFAGKDYTDYILIPNTAYPTLMYRIVGNDANTITVMGTIKLGTNNLYAGPGKTYAIKYGKMIKDVVTTPNSGNKQVKFFNNQGANSFADGDATIDGICQVCHTQTQYFTNTGILDGGGAHPAPGGANCSGCHTHKDNFKASCTSCHGNPPVVTTAGGPNGLADNNGAAPGGTTGSTTPGAHQAHVTNQGIGCASCHYGSVGSGVTHNNGDLNVTLGFYLFGGAQQGGVYDGQITVNYNATTTNPVTTVSKTGSVTCSTVYCHSTVQGAGGTGAPTYATPSWTNTAPNNVQCGSCHKADGVQGNLTLMDSGSHTKHVASPYNKSCSECHNGAGSGTTVHVNNNINMGFAADPYGNTGSYSQSSNTPGNGYGTCSTVYCHSDVQGVDGSGEPSTYATPTWGGAALNCASCHKNMDTDTAATGSHVQHAQTQNIACATCHNGYTETTVNATTHTNKSIDLSFSGQAAGTTYSQGATHAPGNGYGTCSTNQCHGNGTPTWGINTNNNTCTKCHGTPTAGTIDATNRYLVAPPTDTAGEAGTPTGTGQVSNDAQVGAHKTHLLYLNGARSTAIDTQDDRCGYCHGTLPTSGTHANGSAAPVFQGLATHGGSMTASYTAGSCSNTYCHNPAGTGGTLLTANTGSAITPTWTDANYLADPTLKTQANCGKCHKVPGDAGFEPAGTHSGMTIANTDCSGCHGHNGDTGGIAGQRHIDGIKYGGGNCDSCHDYDVVGATYAGGVWTGGTWGKLPYRDGLNPGQGWGAHAKHINHIKTRLGIASALNPVNQTFGVGDPANVCGTCHTNIAANHVMGGSTVRSINFGDGTYKYGGAAGFSFVFGSANPVYNGISGTSSSVNPKTCSNISCHFSTTPVWSSY